MTQAIAYLSFDGNCADAMRFYEQALGAKLEVLMSGAESPIAAQMPKEFAHRILHARLVLPGGGMLYGGDAPAQRALRRDQGRRDRGRLRQASRRPRRSSPRSPPAAG